MAKRIFLKGNYIVIQSDTELQDDIYNLTSNVYVEINGSMFAFYRLTDNKLIETIAFTDILDEDGDAYASQTIFTDLIVAKTGATSNQDVTIQSSISPLRIVKASNLIAETTLTSFATEGHLIINVADVTSFVVGQYLTIYNPDANIVYFGNILMINVLSVTLDTPIDSHFDSGSFVSVGNENLGVTATSVAPVIFGIRNPTTNDIPTKFDITRIIFKCLTADAIELSMFGDIVGGITNGLVARKSDGTFRNIFNVKTNADLKNLMYDIDIETVAKQAQNGFTGRFTFEKLGSVIRLEAGEDLQFIVQDDLSGLTEFNIIAQGAEVKD